ncbi:inositol monophosphatase family protein [Bordetella hinzii]|uniref:Inositol monophosphatase family protein n=1 Tax=Bordetella hinzii OH87 BAL007II TaxID=1331262 RepID=A0ABR4R5V6_9BORD|nr:inositol monophosphatase family protein [Bordetella hinzii]KCB26401.1 inositol monophosphatase family protein [Bordetella hinzii OH87 BAL007II]KCB27894.1 inositol monophosphatase family protein [Bordetella hinzii CA90 BAL1384]KCB41051.1 inositol monophosphatase family protein [Bordetella hinzii 5132]QDJ40140.1 inositol monophosphatase [Bordetella hinzii]QDJ53671.1 inositol monophosphatase [Bordetella hinzii]
MSRTLTRDDLRRIMAILAEAAQVEILPRFRNLPVQAVRGKSSPRDLVTDADEGAERMISARLAKLFPGAVLIGEEATTRNPALLNMLVDADLAFLIDPIDGTRNYVAGLPLFGMMVAACHKGDVMAGIIYDPINRDAAMALRGEGAWFEHENGSQEIMKVAQPVPPEDMDGFIATGSLPEPLRHKVNGNVAQLASMAYLRCAAHEYRMAASGHVHLLFYNKLMPWDHAAGWLLHREAGGYSAHFDGSPYKPTHRSGGLLYAPDAGSWHAAHRLLFGSDEPLLDHPAPPAAA